MKKNINFKQEFGDFLKDESGKMTQENILKLSLTALGSLFFVSGLSFEAQAGGETDCHTNTNTLQLQGTPSPGSDYDNLIPHGHNDHFSHESKADAAPYCDRFPTPEYDCSCEDY